MGTAALEITKRYLEALWEDDVDAAYELLDPDVEVVSTRGTVRGADRVRARWSRAKYDQLAPSLDGREYEQRDGTVHATTRMTWRWTESGEIAYRTRIDGDFVVREGKIARIESVVRHGPA